MNSPTIFLIRSIPIESDSRALRYFYLLKNLNANVTPVSWGNSLIEGAISSPIPRVRDNKWLNIFLTPLFMLWLFFYLLKEVSKKDIVLAIDLDCGLPSYFASCFKFFKYFYDIADPYSICRFNRNLNLINSIESHVAMNAKLTMLPAKSRVGIYRHKFKSLIIENVPSSNFDYEKINLQLPLIRYGYFGMLEPTHRSLEIIAEAIIKSHNAIFYVAGVGGLTNFFSEISRQYPEKIKFFGAYNPGDLQRLSENVDILFGIYALTKIHHQFVAANKTYEHLQLGRPIITNIGTELSDFVKSQQSGWIVENDVCSIVSLIKKISMDPGEIIRRGNLSRDSWDGNYANYWLNNTSVIALNREIKNVLFQL